jgi:ATP-dependent Clp protease adapter protein ClpS
MQSNVQELELPEITTTGTTDFPMRVILFNDDWHSFDEVINQILKATGCTYDRAEQLTWEVHNSGKASVFEGSLEECLKCTSILEEIALHTQIEC